MNSQLGNFSADLRRISYWIVEGNYELSNHVIKLCKEKYKETVSVGCFKNIWPEVEKIEKLVGGKYQAADRALTLSSILMQEAFVK